MKTLSNGLYYFFIVALVAVGLLLMATLVPIPGNIKVKIVKSGSMEPAIHTGSIVAIRPEAAYHVGDVVTFGADTKVQIPTTHRIIAISSDPNPVYTTKGDANDAPDQVNTHLSDIHGKVLFTVPYIGYFLSFARQPLGFALLVGLPAVLIILDEIGKIFKEIVAMRRKKKIVYAHEQTPQTSPKRYVD